jgi:gamma-glutamyl hydrolase
MLGSKFLVVGLLATASGATLGAGCPAFHVDDPAGGIAPVLSCPEANDTQAVVCGAGTLGMTARCGNKCCNGKWFITEADVKQAGKVDIKYCSDVSAENAWCMPDPTKCCTGLSENACNDLREHDVFNIPTNCSSATEESAPPSSESIQDPSPVIGIYPTIDGNYLDAYKKWVGEFGAKTKVFPKESNDVEALFNSVNAFLIPGGGSGLAPLADAMIKRARKAHDAGDYFPVWGTCLGFEWIVESVGGTSSIGPGFDSEDLPADLQFSDAATASRLFKGANSSLMKWFAGENITYNNHKQGILPSKEKKNKDLTSAFSVLATSLDRKSKPFVAMIEGKDGLPIWGSQFHPEKIEFVPTSKSDPHIPKSAHAVAGARYLAQFFVNEARKNNHST